MGTTKRTIHRRGCCAPAEPAALWQVLEERVLLSAGVPLGPATVVGPLADQVWITDAAIAADAAGNLLAVWCCTGGSQGLYGQRIDALGRVQASAFRVDGPSSRALASAVAVATDADGNYAVGWLESDQDLGITRVRVRRFSAQDAPVGQTIEVAADPVGDMRLWGLALAMDADGNLLVSWQQDGADAGQSALWVRGLNTDNEPIWQADVPAATTPRRQTNPALTADDDGNFAVAWSDMTGTWVRRFDSWGAPVGTPVQVNDVLAGTVGGGPALVMDADGAITVAWMSADASGSVWMRTDAGTGTPLGEPVTLLAPVEDWMTQPTLALMPGGAPALAWLEDASWGPGVYLQRLDAPGAPAGPTVRVAGSRRAELPEGPAVAGNSAGALARVWVDAIGSDADVLGIVTAPDGSGQQTILRLVESNGAGTITAAAVAMDEAGNIVVAWLVYDQGTLGTRVAYRLHGPDGAPAGPVRLADSGPAGFAIVSDLSVGIGPDGGVSLAWLRNDGIVSTVWACRYDAAGNAVALPRALSLAAPDGTTLTRPRLAVQADGRLRLVWREYNSSWQMVAIRTALVDPDSLEAGAPMMVASSSDVAMDLPSVAAAHDGAVLVAWRAGWGQIDAQRIGPEGQLIGAQATLWSWPTEGNPAYWRPSIAELALTLSPDGWRVAWRHLDDWSQGAELLDRRVADDLSALQGIELFTFAGQARQFNPALGVADDGTTHVLWTMQDVDPAAEDTGLLGIYLSLGGAAPATDSHVVADPLAWTGRLMALAAGPGDTVVGAWVMPYAGSDRRDLFVQSFTRQGMPTGAAWLVASSEGPDNEILLPDVDVDAAGDVTLVWQIGYTGTGGFRVQRLRAGDGQVELNLWIPQPEGNVRHDPAIAVDDAGNFALAWTWDYGPYALSTIQARQYTRDGQPAGQELTVVQTNYFLFHPADVAMDADGDMVVVWGGGCCGGHGVSGRFYDQAGRPVAGPVLLLAPILDQKTFDPVVAMEPDGNFTLAWRQAPKVGQYSAVFTRRFAAPCIGDFTGDLAITAEDIDALNAEVRAGTHRAEYDLTGDAQVTSADTDYLVGTILGTHYGDFNLDGEVTGRDFLIWQAAYPRLDGAGWADGDANGDAAVSGRDFLIWQANYHPLTSITPTGSHTVGLAVAGDEGVEGVNAVLPGEEPAVEPAGHLRPAGDLPIGQGRPVGRAYQHFIVRVGPLGLAPAEASPAQHPAGPAARVTVEIRRDGREESARLPAELGEPLERFA